MRRSLSRPRSRRRANDPPALPTVNAYLRRRIKPRLAAAASLDAARDILDLRPPSGPPPGALRRACFGGVAGDLVGPPGGAGPMLLYLHGGAYFAGSPEQYRPISFAFARQGFAVFVPAYRLAPFPAPLDDVRAVYAALAAEGQPIFLAGDSAGGWLALALMLASRDAGALLPRAAALFSPWTDLSVSGASTIENEESDALFTRRMLRLAARHYLGRNDARTPLASPLFADLSGLPPLLLHASAAEMLRDDAVRLAARARAGGVTTTLELWPDAPHCWQMTATPQARKSLEKAGAFLLCVDGQGRSLSGSDRNGKTLV